MSSHPAHRNSAGADRRLSHIPVPSRPRIRRDNDRLLKVIKFGGTSLGDASCIQRAIEIVKSTALDGDLVVVVSAMAGVTNKLIEAATRAAAGDRSIVSSILKELRERHLAVAHLLIHSSETRATIEAHIDELFNEGRCLCDGTMFLRELTPRVLDTISSLGERLSAPLVAAALTEQGLASEAIEAVELIVTDSCHGAAEPFIDLTRKRSEQRLNPLRQQRIVPIVTGFIGATAEGVRTTLGRGGSDYSATILGAALDADEVVIWTDVNGLMTADPRLVPTACTIPEISYREASELAYFGAKVLHPKALRPVMLSEIPLSIRNTFSPDGAGTRIVPEIPSHGTSLKALTAMKDVALITVGGPGFIGVTDVVGRAFATIAALRADVLLISQSSSQNEFCLIVPAAVARHTVEALRREFAHDLARETTEHIALENPVAIVSLVGQNMRGPSGIAGRTFGALDREGIGIIAIAQGSSDCNVSFVVAQQDVQAAVITTHEEFQLGSPNTPDLPLQRPSESADRYYAPEIASADAD
ncbi:MAG TPA: aspartate kinase [Terriglobales bacterium]